VVEGLKPKLTLEVGVVVGEPVSELVEVEEGEAPRVTLAVGVPVGLPDRLDVLVEEPDAHGDRVLEGVPVGLPVNVEELVVDGEDPTVRLEDGVPVGLLVREVVPLGEKEAPTVRLGVCEAVAVEAADKSPSKGLHWTAKVTGTPAGTFNREANKYTSRFHTPVSDAFVSTRGVEKEGMEIMLELRPQFSLLRREKKGAAEFTPLLPNSARKRSTTVCIFCYKT
jgi:hypothetical protein